MKKEKIIATIHRTNLPTFSSIHKIPGNTSGKTKSDKKTGFSQRLIDIARARGHTMNEILEYDIIPDITLFQEDGLMRKGNKSLLTAELEKQLTPDDYIFSINQNDERLACIVDTMAYVRKVKTSDITTFGELCASVIKITHCHASVSKRVDYVFDAYCEGTIKDSERKRRSHVQPIELSKIDSSTKLPVEMEKFWPSSKNKLNLEIILHKEIIETSNKYVRDQEVVAGFIPGENAVECISISNRNMRPYPELNLYYEEADALILHHVVHLLRCGFQNILVLSADTDVLVILLHFFFVLQELGLKELWVRSGIRESVRHIPVMH